MKRCSQIKLSQGEMTCHTRAGSRDPTESYSNQACFFPLFPPPGKSLLPLSSSGFRVLQIWLARLLAFYVSNALLLRLHTNELLFACEEWARSGSSREEIGKWLKNKSIPWQRRRRLLQVVTGTFPCGQQIVKYGYKRTVECILCKKVHEESGNSWNRELPAAKGDNWPYSKCGVPWTNGGGHCSELLQEVNVHGKANRHMKLLTIEAESRLGTLWDQEQCLQFCSKDEVWEAAKGEEMKIPWKEASEGQPEREDQYQERF
jgi:hypothetical protein